MNNSSKADDAVKEVYAKKLIRPVVTRQNSKYDSVKRLMDCHKNGKRADVCDALQEPRLTSHYVEILEEYMQVMEPLAVVLDILQGEEKCFFGTIHTTIKSLERKLKKLKDLANVSQPLVHVLLVGLEKRLPTTLDEKVLHARDYVIAIASHPVFKLKWFSDSQKDVAVEPWWTKRKSSKDFRSTDEADKRSFLSGDEYIDLSDEKTTRDNSGTVAVKPIL